MEGFCLCRFLSNIFSVGLLHALLVLHLGAQVFQCDIRKKRSCSYVMAAKQDNFFFFQHSHCAGLYKRGQYHYSLFGEGQRVLKRSEITCCNFFSLDTRHLCPCSSHSSLSPCAGTWLALLSACLAFCFYTLFCSLLLSVGGIWCSYPPEWLPVATYRSAQNHSQVCNTELKSCMKFHSTS